MAACNERQPTSSLFAIRRLPSRKARPCVSRAVKIELSEPLVLNTTTSAYITNIMGAREAAPRAMRRFDMPEDARLRRLTKTCERFPETARETHGSHASFLVRKKVFAYFLNDHH